MTRISVIIPAYQSANTIADAIHSVLNQSFQDFEIIVIDDGSTDMIEEVLIPFKDKIKFLRQKNLGVAVARNHGIKNSSGEIIAFLDADDIWFPDKLALQMALFNKNPNLGVVFGNVYFWSLGKFHGKTYFDFFPPHRGQILLPLFANDFIPLLSILVRRKTLEQVGLFDENVRYVEDYELLLRIALDWDFDYIEKPLGAYRISSQQVSKNFTQVATFLLNMKIDFYQRNASVLLKADRKIIERGLYNKYLRLALCYLRDGNSHEAARVLDSYFKVRGRSMMYLVMSILVKMPNRLMLFTIQLLDKLRQKPELGLY